MTDDRLSTPAFYGVTKSDPDPVLASRRIVPEPGRKRRAKYGGIETMGLCAISSLRDDDLPIPENVADIRRARLDLPVDEARLALRLALALFAVIPEEGKGSIRRAIRLYADHSADERGSECRRLHELLSGDQP